MIEHEMTESDEGSAISMTSEGEISASSLLSWERVETSSNESSDSIEAVKVEDGPLLCNICGLDVIHPFKMGPNSPMRNLERFLNKLLSEPSRHYRIRLYKLVITRPLMTKLLPLISPKQVTPSSLHHDDENISDHDVHSPGTTKRNRIYFFSSRFFSESNVTISEQNDDICTPEDKFRFLSAVASHPFDSIKFMWCPEILSEFLSISEIDHVQTNFLRVSQDMLLSESEYIRLGAIIQKSVQLTSLTLLLSFVNVPRAFLNSLANSIHLKVMILRCAQNLAGQLVGGNGNGILDGMLRNPQNQLESLNLEYTGLEDHHLIALANLLPASKVKSLHFKFNKIQSHGLLEFTRRIPKMTFMTKISLSWNPWESSPLEVREECGKALLCATMENPCFTWVDELRGFPQRDRLCHQLALNRTLRKLLKPSRPHDGPENRSIPDGLWPHILARIEMCFEKGESRLPVDPVDAVYFFLQRCPGLFSGCNKQQPQPFS